MMCLAKLKAAVLPTIDLDGAGRPTVSPYRQIVRGNAVSHDRRQLREARIAQIHQLRVGAQPRAIAGQFPAELRHRLVRAVAYR